MVLEWRKQEYEDMDQESLQDPPTLNVLCQNGLLNFFCASPMRANVRLLELLINYCNHDLGMFDLQGEVIEITSEDVYFISNLLRWGA